jgi:hypothetical protein
LAKTKNNVEFMNIASKMELNKSLDKR